MVRNFSSFEEFTSEQKKYILDKQWENNANDA